MKRKFKMFSKPTTVFQVAPHPTGPELDEYIKNFGRRNKHLAAGKSKQAAWFVSHCATQASQQSYCNVSCTMYCTVYCVL